MPDSDLAMFNDVFVMGKRSRLRVLIDVGSMNVVVRWGIERSVSQLWWVVIREGIAYNGQIFRCAMHELSR
jgi:hypothetical protein